MCINTINCAMHAGMFTTHCCQNSLNLAHSSVWFPAPACGSLRLHYHKDVADKIIGQFSLIIIVSVIDADSGLTHRQLMRMHWVSVEQ